MVGKSFTAGEDIFDLKKKEFRITGKYLKDMYLWINHYKARSFIKNAEKPTLLESGTVCTIKYKLLLILK